MTTVFPDARVMNVPIQSERQALSSPKFLRPVVHTFTLPNGRRAKVESMEGKNSVGIFALTEKGTILLAHQYRFPVGQYMYELPGGIIERDEDPLQAANREFLEETGCVSREPLVVITEAFPWAPKCNAKQWIYLSLGFAKVAEPELDEIEAYTGLHIVEQSPQYILRQIKDLNSEYDRSIHTALLVLLADGIISF